VSLRKSYSCDLCGTTISAGDGVGVIHKAGGEIEAVYLLHDGAGHHLCNRCVSGLRGMLDDLDALTQQHADLDAAEREGRS
jgi:hypothetical protein